MFKCNICNCFFPTITAYNSHQKIHRNVGEIEILCLYLNCNAKLTSYESFRKHIYRKHNYVDNEGNYLCKLKDCNFQTTNFALINKHVKNHLTLSNNGVPCPFSRCIGKRILFYNKNSYTVHVLRNHFDEKRNVTDTRNDNLEGIPNSFPGIGQVVGNVCNATSTFSDQASFRLECKNVNSSFSNEIWTSNCINSLLPLTSSKEVVMSDIYKKAINLCLTLSTKHNATEPIIQEVVSNFYEIFELCKNEFSTSLLNSDLSEEDKAKVASYFNNSFQDVTNAFGTERGFLRNTYNRKMFYNKTLNLVLPEEVNLLDENDEVTGYTYSYVPIKETLTSMLSVPSIRRYCENVTVPENGRL